MRSSVIWNLELWYSCNAVLRDTCGWICWNKCQWPAIVPCRCFKSGEARNTCWFDILRNSKAPVVVAQNASFSDSQRTSPSRETHETDTPDTSIMRRSRVHSEKNASLKLPFDLKKSVTITSQDGVHENYSHLARRRDGTTGTTGMGTSCERGIHSSRKEEHLARTRGEGDEVRDERQSERIKRTRPS